MKQDLKSALREDFESQGLSAEQLQQLQSLFEEPESDQKNTGGDQSKRAGYRFWLMGLVASIFVALIVWPPLFNRYQVGLSVERIAAEVVSNHLNRKPMEVQSERLEGVLEYFAALGFSPLQSNWKEVAGLSLVGGRYCSIQGDRAAQLRFKSEERKGLSTLYQVPFDHVKYKDLPALDEGSVPTVTFNKGVKVSVWVEKGILFALAEDVRPVHSN